jgi:hypothetical protein
MREVLLTSNYHVFSACPHIVLQICEPAFCACLYAEDGCLWTVLVGHLAFYLPSGFGQWKAQAAGQIWEECDQSVIYSTSILFTRWSQISRVTVSAHFAFQAALPIHQLSPSSGDSSSTPGLELAAAPHSSWCSVCWYIPCWFL